MAATTAALNIAVAVKGVKAAQAALKKLKADSEGAGGAGEGAGNSYAAMGKKLLVAAKAGSIAAAGIAVVGTAAAAAAKEMADFAAATAAEVIELENLAKVGGLSAFELQKLEFQLSGSGINAEKLSDQFKDINDRLGEFLTVGTGAFKDLTDTLGLSEGEARKLATELAGMSGKGQIERIAKEFDDANISIEAATFASESLADELSKVIGRFRNGGAEAEKAGNKFDAALSSMQLSHAQKKDLADFSESWRLLGEQAEASKKQLAALAADTLKPLVDFLLTYLPPTTEKVTDFFNSFRDAKNIKSNDSIERLIENIDEKLQRAKASVEAFQAVQGQYKGSSADLTNAKNEVEEYTERLSDLKKQLAALKKAEEEDKPKEVDSVIKLSKSNDDCNCEDDGDKKAANTQLESLREYLEARNALKLNYDEALQSTDDEKLAEQAAQLKYAYDERIALLEEQRAEELLSQEEFNKLKLELDKNYFDDIEEAELESFERREKFRKKQEKDEEKLKKDEIKANKKAEDINTQTLLMGAQAAVDISKQFGEENKAIQAANLLAQAGIAAAQVMMYTEVAIANAKAQFPLDFGTIEAALRAKQAVSLGIIAANAVVSTASMAARDQGGQVSAGVPYIVGENRPEVFVPNSNGSIQQMGSASQAPSVTIINETSEPIEDVETSWTEGELVVLIRNTVSGDTRYSNSDISKSFNQNTQAKRQRL